MSRPSAKRIKSRWTPQTPRGAQSLLDQMERAILAGKVSNDHTSTPFTTVDMPIHVANYMLDAIQMIRGGVDANAAFHLVAGKRGRKHNSERDALIAIRIRQRQRTYTESQEAATYEIARQFKLPFETTVTARNNGRKIADFYEDIQERSGETVALEYVEHFAHRVNQG